MPKQPEPSVKKVPAKFRADQLPGAIAKLQRRLDELNALKIEWQHDYLADAQSIAAKVNDTLRSVYGHESLEASEWEVKSSSFLPRWAPATDEDRHSILNKTLDRVK